jgi:CRP-like cAMP-binding protein
MKHIISSTVIWKSSDVSYPRRRKQVWVIHPDNRFKIYWNILVIISMSISITLSPYQMAFEDQTTGAFLVLEILFDSVFFVDILLTCVTGYYNKDLNLVTIHSKILKKYLKSWFFIDILACFPIHLIIDIGVQYNSLMKISRFKLVWRLIRLFKLFRLIKILKSKGDSNNLYLALKFSIQLERLISFLFFIGFIIHIIACFWIFVAKVINQEETWIKSGGFQELNNGELYSIGLYWSVTTLTTVGYGDIYPKNQPERIFAFVIMIVGIISYSYTVSSISNLFSTFNTRQALLDQKLDLLNTLSRKLKLSHRFHMRLSIAVQYEHRNHDKEVDMIIEDLPANLSQKLIQMIYSEKIENNSFFEGKPKGFTDWVTPFLQPVRHNKNELVVREGEFASEMFLIYKGEVNYVFVKNGSFYPYGNLAENYYFGEVDILFSEKKNYLASVFTETGCELLSLSREKFEEMIEKFEDEAIEICMKAKERLERMNKRQEEIINAVEKTIDFRENDLSSDKKRELFEHRTVRRSVENNALFRSNSAFNKIKKLKNHDNHLPKIKSSCEKISLFSENIKGMSRDLVELMYAKGLKYD